jgi:PAS domain-containing protein
MMAAAPSRALLTRSARIFCFSATVIGLIGVAAWLLHLEVIDAFGIRWPVMMPNTAIALTSLGLSAAFVRVAAHDPRMPGFVATLLALLVLGIGVATLSEYALHVDFGVDRWLSPQRDATDPGRPSPLTAIALTLLAAALLARPSTQNRLLHAAQAMTLAGGFVAFASVVAYVFGAGRFYEVTSGPVRGVTLPTAIALLLASAGTLLRDPDRGVMGLLTGPRPAGVLARRLGLVAVLGFPLLGALSYRAMMLLGLADTPLMLAIVTVASVPLALVFIVLTADALDHAYRDLEVSREQARMLVDEGVDGIFIADIDGRYTDVNATGCRMLGLSRGEIVGKTILDFIPDEKCSSCRTPGACSSPAQHRLPNGIFAAPMAPSYRSRSARRFSPTAGGRESPATSPSAKPRKTQRAGRRRASTASSHSRPTRSFRSTSTSGS